MTPLPPQYNENEILTSPLRQDVIGTGSYGVVRRVFHREKLGIAAVKVFQVTGSRDRQTQVIKKVKEEAEILVLLNHENIVRCHGILLWSNFFVIIMDYLPGGDLNCFLHSLPLQDIPYTLRFRILHEISKALKYLHKTVSGLDQREPKLTLILTAKYYSKASNSGLLEYSAVTDQELRSTSRCIHNDLKPKNILLTSDLHALIGDFGAASIGTKTSEQTQGRGGERKSIQYTLRYVSPEVLQTNSSSTASDIYSLGIILFEVISRKQPYEGVDENQLFHQIAEGLRPNVELCRPDNEMSQPEQGHINLMIDLMQNCWQSDNNRPTAITVERSLSEVMSSYTALQLTEAVFSVHQHTTIGQYIRPTYEMQPINEVLRF